MLKHALLGAAALGLVTGAASAAGVDPHAAYVVRLNPNGGAAAEYVNGTAIGSFDETDFSVNPQGSWHANSQSHPAYIYCMGGCSGGGGGGGPATQSGTWQVNLGYNGNTVSPSNALGTADLALDALIAGGALKVSGAFFQATQPVSLAALPPLPAGSAAIGSVSVSNLPATQAVSAANLPLPAGAATSANQTAPVAAGAASTAAMPVQGTAGGVSVATVPGAVVHTTSAMQTIAAGGSAVILAAGKIVTGCDINSSGAYTYAYTTPAAPGTVTASATVGLMLSASASYHCPFPAPTQGLSVYNPGSSAITVGADAY